MTGLEAELRELVRSMVREELEAETGLGAPDRLLSIPEAAESIGVSRTLLYDLLARGELRSIRAGRRRLVPASAVREFGEGGG